MQVFPGEDTSVGTRTRAGPADSVDGLGPRRLPPRAFPVLLDHSNGPHCSSETSILPSEAVCISWRGVSGDLSMICIAEEPTCVSLPTARK